MLSNAEKATLRSHYRAQRRSLSLQYQEQASLDVVKQFIPIAQQYKPNSVALFIANDGELSTDKIARWCWDNDITTLLPVVKNAKQGLMTFHTYSEDSVLSANQFGILEPSVDAPSMSTDAIDLVLLPLVAFDQHGHRLGMGGGFYDRAFANCHNVLLFGIAHDCQQTAALPVDSWDISLRGVITPTSTIDT